jgi:hypothetical protein
VDFLVGDAITQYLPIVKNGRRRIVAGRFDAQDENVHFRGVTF